EVVSLNKVVGNLTAMLARLIGEQVTLKCEFMEELPLVEADVCSIEQAFMNRVVNARDAMRTGGHLFITTSSQEIDAAYAADHPEAVPGSYVCLTVRDTGCGMDEQTLNRLFEPFFTTKEVGKGTGMGLATAYGIIKQHNGWIEVDSTLTSGATFRVYLPVSAKEQAPPAKKPGLPDALGGREKILVVEDEEPVCNFVCDLLVEYGYNVRIASNGVEALKVWEEAAGDVDLLLTDVVMPREISGVQLASRLLSEKNDLKVIYTSGYSIELLD